MPGLGVRFRLERVFYSVGIRTWQHGVLSRKLRGHYSFYGITGNSVAITRFRHEVRSRWRKWLSRRGGRSPMSWPQFHRLEERHLLPAAIAVHSSSRRAANRTHELRSRMRESCTSGSWEPRVGDCPGRPDCSALSVTSARAGRSRLRNVRWRARREDSRIASRLSRVTATPASKHSRARENSDQRTLLTAGVRTMSARSRLRSRKCSPRAKRTLWSNSAADGGGLLVR